MPAVAITLHGTMQRSLPSGEKTVTVEIQAPSTPRELLEGLGLPIETVSLLYLNDERVQMDAEVKPGDVLEVFPLLCGG
jgi:sulfur carrier protein ThiS